MNTNIASFLLLSTTFLLGGAASAAKPKTTEAWPVKEGQAQIVLVIGKMPLCDFMPVTVLPDKRYYAVVVSRWPDGTTLRPVRHQGDGYVYGTEQFLDLLNFTTIAGRAPDSMIKEEKRKAEEVYAAKWAQWSAKTPEQKAALTIRAEDSE